jgi:beta-lactamase regulating signal transducer with metallopeptidase domain
MNVLRFIQTLKLIHIALVVGLTIFSVLAYAQNNSFNADINTNSTLLYIVPIVALLGYFGSQMFFKKMLLQVHTSDSLQTKLNKYQTAAIVKYALIEGPAFIALFVYHTTGNALPLVIAVCLLAYLFVQKPTKDKIIDSLNLTSDERSALDVK